MSHEREKETSKMYNKIAKKNIKMYTRTNELPSALLMVATDDENVERVLAALLLDW